MPEYFDTNIFVYSFLNQGIEKQNLSTKLIDDAITVNKLCISNLVIQEFVYF